MTDRLAARLRSAVLALALLGAGLRTLQYLGAPPLWLDEVAIARCILDLDLLPLLTQPLPHGQVSPKGFLLVEKLVAGTLGSSDLALRLFPFLASLVSLVAFRLLALRLLAGPGALAAMALFALAPSLIYYGAAMKPYSSDAAICVLLLVFAFELAERPPPRARAFAIGLAGAALVWFSLPALLVISGLGALLFMRPRVLADRSSRNALLPALVPWGVSTVAAALVSVGSVTAEGMDHQALFWGKGYPPSTIDSPLDLFWPIGRITSLYGSRHWASLAYPEPSLFVVLTGLGFVALWRRRREAALILLTPVAMAIVAAWLHRYPFKERLILFLIPVFLLAIAAGIEWLHRWGSTFSPRAAALGAAALVAFAISPVAIRPPPYGREDVVPLIDHLRAQRRPGDAVYVFYAAAPAVDFYAARRGLAPEDYFVGGCHRGDSAGYLEELDQLRGRSRVWLLITHASRHNERRDVLGYLETIGTRKQRLTTWPRAVSGKPQPADLYLYDLSDATRLRAASARTFPLHGPSDADWHVPCGQGPIAIVPGEFPLAR